MKNKRGQIGAILIILAVLALGVGTYFVVKSVTGNAITGNVISGDAAASTDGTSSSPAPSTPTPVTPVSGPAPASGGGGGGGGGYLPAAEPVITVSGDLAQIITLSSNEGFGSPIVISNIGGTDKTVTLSSTNDEGVEVEYVQIGQVELTSKETIGWTATPDKKATVYYTLVGDEFYYKVDSDLTEYVLVYYKDSGATTDTGKPWNYVNAVNLGGASSTWITSTLAESLPVSTDYNANPEVEDSYCNSENGFDSYLHCSGAKLWLMPETDWNQWNSGVGVWNPSAWLFETDLITYTDTVFDENVVIPAQTSVTVLPYITSKVGSLELTSKETIGWTATPDKKATVYYTLVGDEFYYKVDSDLTGYVLVYYKDSGATTDTGKPWNYVNAVNLGGASSTWITSTLAESLPVSTDYNANPEVEDSYCNSENGFDSYLHCSGAKLWLMPEADWAQWNSGVGVWNPSAWLFETDLITYTKVSEIPITVAVTVI